MDILIDFDGTCVVHDFPNVSPYDIGAEKVLKELVREGNRLILFTMRADRKLKCPTHDESILDVTGAFLTDAVKWFEDRGIELYGVQKNPTQHHWTTSPKAYGHLMIDDSAVGCPLTYDTKFERPYVNWKAVRRILKKQGLIKK